MVVLVGLRMKESFIIRRERWSRRDGGFSLSMGSRTFSGWRVDGWESTSPTNPPTTTSQEKLPMGRGVVG